MGKWTYVTLNILFFTPVLVLVWKKYRRTIMEEKRFLVIAGLFGFCIFFIIDPLATYWGAWGFDYTKTLGIRFGFSVIEELVWAMLVSTIVALAVSVGARKEENGERFRISDLLKSKNPL